MFTGKIYNLTKFNNSMKFTVGIASADKKIKAVMYDLDEISRCVFTETVFELDQHPKRKPFYFFGIYYNILSYCHI